MINAHIKINFYFFRFFIFYFNFIFSLIIFNIDKNYGIIFSCFSYIIIFFINFIFFKKIINFIQIYLLIMFYLTFVKFIPLMNYDFISFNNLKMYIFNSIQLTSFLTLLFKFPFKEIYFDKSNNSKSSYNFFYFIICVLFNMSIIYGSGPISYFVTNIFISFALIFFLLFFLNSRNFILIIALFLFTFYSYSNFQYNRTYFLLVPFSFLLVFFLKQKKIKISKIFFFMFLFLILLIFGDLYKNYNSIYYSELSWNILYFDINPFMNQLFNNRYLEIETYILDDYFFTLNFLIDKFKDYGENFIYQLISFVKPSYFFPDKDITNISTLLYAQGYNKNPLYFEIFIEASYNLGLAGVFCYYFIILAVGNFFYKSILIFENNSFSNFVKINYVIFLIMNYLLLRGPIIILIQYFFISFIILLFLRFIKKNNLMSKYKMEE
jgi:hypothetical protein